MKQVKYASFTNNKGLVIFEDDTQQEMTYEEYKIMSRDYNPSSIAKLIRFIQIRGAFYYAGHNRPLYQVWTEGSFEFFHGKNCITRTEYEKIMKLLTRYQRFYTYVKETSPQWKKVREIYWADNSIEELQINKYGEERTIMIVAPHGDAC